MFLQLDLFIKKAKKDKGKKKKGKKKKKEKKKGKKKGKKGKKKGKKKKGKKKDYIKATEDNTNETFKPLAATKKRGQVLLDS